MEPEVVYDKIPNGLDDIAKYLGLNPDKTIFMHSTSFDEHNPDYIKRKAINKGRMLYAEILSYSSNKKNGAKSAIAYYNKDFLKYYDEIGIINLDNIVEVGENRKIEYPYNSVSKMLNERLKKDNELREKLNGYTIVSSYLSLEDEENAKLINGSLIMDVKEQERFNSKYEFRKMSEKHKFSMPEGIAFNGVFNLAQELNRLANKYKNIGVWIKLENQSSGTGNIFISNLSNLSIDVIKSKVTEVGLKIYDEQYVLNKMPLIVEVDVNSIDNEKEIENIGVEAVISENKVTILGGVSQAVKDGVYLGSEMTDKTYKYIKVAEECAKYAFIALCKEGYRGFITIDVLVTKNSNTGEIKAYNIDPNARFSAGTMLLKNIHSAEKEANQKMYGLSYANAIQRTDKLLNEIKNAAGENVYNIKSKVGIIPALINDVSEIKKGGYYLKSVVVDTSYERALEKYKDFKKLIEVES